MGLTPNMSFPYPELTDPPNVPADIQKLASAIDADPFGGGFQAVYVAGTIGSSLPLGSHDFTKTAPKRFGNLRYSGSGTEPRVGRAGLYLFVGNLFFEKGVQGQPGRDGFMLTFSTIYSCPDGALIGAKYFAHSSRYGIELSIVGQKVGATTIPIESWMANMQKITLTLNGFWMSNAVLGFDNPTEIPEP